MKRRDWLKIAGSGAMAGAVGLGSSPLYGSLRAGGSGGPRPWGDQAVLGLPPARNLIFYVYDGTGFEDLATATHFSERVLGRPLLLRELLERSASGAMYTHSLSSVVTDSAAASSAWSTGRKVGNYAISMFPDGTPLTTILELARDSGRATGLVTTTRMTHATPAAWIAKSASRSAEDEIARQYLDFRPDVLMGGGAGHFLPDSRGDGRDLTREFRDAGYDVLRSGEELARSNASRLLGLFSGGTRHLPYEIDRLFQEAASPSLAEMAGKALSVLDGAERGFVLQVEAGRIDHANHDNDAASMVRDYVAADDALRVILDYVERTPETLLIFAPDHDTGGGNVYGYGTRYEGSSRAFDALERQRMSYERFSGIMGRDPSAQEVREGCVEFLRLDPTENQVEALGSVFRREARPGHPTAQSGVLNSIHAVLSAIPPGATLDRPNFVYSTGAHTAGVVPVALYGAGVENMNLGLVDNTELFGWMTEALRIRFENPQVEVGELQDTLEARGTEPPPEGMHPWDHPGAGLA